MAWALPAIKKYPNSFLIPSSSKMLLRHLNKRIVPSTPLRFPILNQQSNFASSSWTRFQHGPRINLNKNILMVPAPFTSYSTLVASIQELKPDSNDPKAQNPCDLSVGAAWAPKRPRSNLPKWCRADCGEDAFFTLLVNNNYCLGVADGVGGWSEVGVDPSQFAWELMNLCQSYCESLGLVGKVDPKLALSKAYKELIRQNKVKAGSSTACMAVVNTDTGIITSVNLGDSGYVILRNGKVAYRSSETTHYFNAPYQLSVIPPEMKSNDHIQNTPEQGQVASLQLEHGDLVVMGTDGLFDNLFHSEIETEAQKTCPSDIENLLAKSDSSQAALKAYTNSFAGALVRRARLRASDKKADSPFSTEAAKNGYKYRGGKMDDITVVAALITMKKSPKPRF